MYVRLNVVEIKGKKRKIDRLCVILNMVTRATTCI